MARFTSIHPLHLTQPAVRFHPDGDVYALDTDDESTAAALRTLPASFHVVEVLDRDLEDLTIPELKDEATKRGIDLGGASLKADIVAAIRDHIEHPEPPSGGEPETTPVVLVSSDADAESQPVDAVDDRGDTE
ncbi:hypothetical protein [Terrabacter sp. NPDC000476]|uniref:SAP domain-containing protein n=1 Tax=Terrabacter sp. NPDC000476 TaxID=3154258 RepID=UPI0033247BAF